MSDRMLRIRCSNADFERWVQVSQSEGYRNLSEWIRRRLNADGPVATQVLRAESLPDIARVSAIPSVSAASQFSEGQAVVVEVEPVRRGSMVDFILRTSDDRSHTVTKKMDLNALKWGQQDLMAYCVEQGYEGFGAPWKACEAEVRSW